MKLFEHDVGARSFPTGSVEFRGPCAAEVAGPAVGKGKRATVVGTEDGMKRKNPPKAGRKVNDEEDRSLILLSKEQFDTLQPRWKQERRHPRA
jgi:hypothetical protein